MGKYYSDEVELALKYVFYEERLGKGKEGMALLEKASAAGDGDASCLLARCFWGPQYIWPGHRFPEDDKRGKSLIRLSIKQGSALGVLCALRSGLLTPSASIPWAICISGGILSASLAKAGRLFPARRPSMSISRRTSSNVNTGSSALLRAVCGWRGATCATSI